MYENHAKPGAWTYTDFSQPPEIFTEIVRRTADVGLGVNFDTGNAATFAADPLGCSMKSSAAWSASMRPTRPCAARLRHVLLGTGVTPYPALFQRLARAGWDGWICMEEASFQGARRGRGRGQLRPADMAGGPTRGLITRSRPGDNNATPR